MYIYTFATINKQRTSIHRELPEGKNIIQITSVEKNETSLCRICTNVTEESNATH